MANKYSFQEFDKETMTRACGTNLAISFKKTVETLSKLKGKKVSAAISFLNEVIAQKTPVPYNRYGAEMGHRRGKGISTGGFPVKVAQEVLHLIESANKNASELELGDNLYIISISARKGITRYHNGRYSGRKMKSTSVEVVIGGKK